MSLGQRFNFSGLQFPPLKVESKRCCEDLIKRSINGAGLVVHIKVWTPGALGFRVATLLVYLGVKAQKLPAGPLGRCGVFSPTSKLS